MLLLFALAKKKIYSSDMPLCAMMWVPYTSLIDLHDRCVLTLHNEKIQYTFLSYDAHVP